MSSRTFQQKRVYPYPLGAGSARPNPKMGAADPENPLFLGFSVLRGASGPWSETMVSEGARPWGRGRSGDNEHCLETIFASQLSLTYSLCRAIRDHLEPFLLFLRTLSGRLFWSQIRTNLIRATVGFPREQKIAVNKFWVQESEIGEECRQFWT